MRRAGCLRPLRQFHRHRFLFTATTAQSLTLRHHVIQEFEEEPQTVDWITSTFTYENPR
jgi:hypothetical protein